MGKYFEMAKEMNATISTMSRFVTRWNENWYWQGEDLVPVGVERFVLGLRLQPRIVQLEDAERVRLAADVRRRQFRGPVHLHAQVAHVAQVLQRPVRHLLTTAYYYYYYDFINYLLQLQVHFHLFKFNQVNFII